MPTKILKKDKVSFGKVMERWFLNHGFTPNDGMYDLVYNTPSGRLWASIELDLDIKGPAGHPWIAMRWEHPDKVPPISGSLNPHSGKWNWHMYNDETLDQFYIRVTDNIATAIRKANAGNQEG